MSKYIVVTRPGGKNREFAKRIEKMGLRALSYPTIKIKREGTDIHFLQNFKESHWVVFTSANAVKYLLKKIDKKLLIKKKIAVVGKKTAEEAEKYCLVSFIPSQFTTEFLGKEIPVKKGEKVFLPRADIATPSLVEILERRGAIVFNTPIYKTEFIKKENRKLKEYLMNKRVSLITFSSPSTIEGFMRSLNPRERTLALKCEILVIGPVTQKKAEEAGFKNISVADTYTTEGMIEKISSIIGS